MEFNSFNPKPWKISKKNERDFNVKKVERALTVFNKSVDGDFYIVDYLKNKFIIGASHSPTVYGYPKKLLQDEQFDFFERVLSKDDMIWFTKMRQDALRIFYKHKDLNIRMEWEISYNLTAKSESGQKVIIWHKLIPCDLDDNGNLWRSLLYVSTSPFSPKEHHAEMVNFATGENYNFINNKFRLSKYKALTHDEIQILEYLAKGIPPKQIWMQMGIKKTTFSAKKRSAFKKLDVKNQTAAACRAMALGYITV